MSLNRRGFIVGSVSAAVAPASAEVADATARAPVPPPGVVSTKGLLAKCTACNLCIARCPSKVLRSAGLEYGLSGFMMPRMDFSRGFCRPDCNECGEVCPAGAIRPFSPADKKNLRLAVAVYDKALCVVTKEGYACGNCAAHCPYKAIEMKKAADGKAYPAVKLDACAGCGACEYHCPTKAIAVVGREG